MKRLFITSALVGSTLLIASAASAQTSPNPDGQRADRMERQAEKMAKVDTNNDGLISAAEFAAPAMMRFDATDTNGDGLLDEAERSAARDAHKANRAERQDKRRGVRFDRQDTNNDGVLTKAEVEGAAQARSEMREAKRAERKARMMEKVDTDGDGTISDAERTAAREVMKAKRAERKAMRKDARTERGDRPARVKTDANEDGFISRDEYMTRVTARFERSDKNGDGMLAADEMNLRGHHKGRKGPHKDRRAQR